MDAHSLKILVYMSRISLDAVKYYQLERFTHIPKTILALRLDSDFTEKLWLF